MTIQRMTLPAQLHPQTADSTYRHLLILPQTQKERSDTLSLLLAFDVHTGWQASECVHKGRLCCGCLHSTLDDEKLGLLFALGAPRRRVPIGKFRLLQINNIRSVLILIDKHVDGNVHVFFAYNVHPFKHPFCNQLCSRFTTAYPYRIATSLFYHTWGGKETPIPHLSCLTPNNLPQPAKIKPKKRSFSTLYRVPRERSNDSIQ